MVLINEKVFHSFETSSTAMTYTLFEMSQNQEVQDKARDNVMKVLEKHDGLFTYEALSEMNYVENCISGEQFKLFKWQTIESYLLAL